MKLDIIILGLTGLVCGIILLGRAMYSLVNPDKQVIVGTPILHHVTRPLVWPPVLKSTPDSLSIAPREIVIDNEEFDITDFGTTLTETQMTILGDIEDTLLK